MSYHIRPIAVTVSYTHLNGGKAETMEARANRTAIRSTQLPRPNRSISHRAPKKQRLGGKTSDSPNWVTSEMCIRDSTGAQQNPDQLAAHMDKAFRCCCVKMCIRDRYYGTCHSYIHSLFFLIVPVQLPRTVLSAEPVFRWNQRRSLFPVLLCAVPPGSNMEYSG